LASAAHVVSFQSHFGKTDCWNGGISSSLSGLLGIFGAIGAGRTESGGCHANPVFDAIPDDVVRHRRLDVPHGLDGRRRRHGGLYEGAAALPGVAPAVDAVNGKFDGFAGSVAGKSVSGVNGIVSLPLGGQYGAQFDGTIGSLTETPSLPARDTCSGAIRHAPCSACMSAKPLGSLWRDQRRACRRRRRVPLGPIHAARHRRRRVRQFGFDQHQHDLDRPVFTTTTTFVDAYHVKTRFFDDQPQIPFGDDSAAMSGTVISVASTRSRSAPNRAPAQHGTLASAFVEAGSARTTPAASGAG
jgi:hypothetical protein